MYNKFKLGFRLILLFLFLGTSATYAQNLITVSFSNGFVGNNTGTNSSGNSYYLSALGWTKVQFAQNSTGNSFVESAQGNDIIGMVIITDANGIQHTIDGFVKWRAPSGSVTTLVFQPSSNATLATNSANGSATYTINNTKYIGLTFNGSTLTIPNSGANAGEVTGNAATNGLLELLNSYLDAQPKITIAGAGLNVSESVGNAVITLNLSVAASTSVSVNYTTADSSAIAGLDYTTTSGTATFAPGQTTKTFSVPIIDDNTSESSEIIKVTFSDPVNASLLGNMAFINIADNENTDNTAPVITGPNGSGTTTGANSFKSIPENTTAVYTFTANEPVTWSISGGIDQAKFNINPTTGLVTFVDAPDFDNPTDNDGNNTYIVIIQASDAAGNIITQTLTVTVLKDFDGDGNPDIDDTDDDNDGIPDIDELDCSASTGISQSLNPSPFYFVQWNSFINGVLSGTINIAGDIVNVTVTNSMNSIISYGGAPYAGTGNWAPAPTSGDGSAGTFYSYTEGEHKFVFDKPVNNPRFFINSLNRTLDLSQPGKILSSNGMFTGTPTGSTTSVLVGNEANGTISFTGNVSEISFTGRAREYYCTFSLGVAGISDFSSCVDKDTDGDGTPDRLDADSDGDGVTDAQERLDGTDPYDLCSFVLANQTQTPSAAWNTTDCDSDGVDNLTEVNQGTDPLVANPPPVITGPNGAGTTTGANAYKSIPENTTAVYTYTADRTVTWSINGGVDAAKFIIDSTTGVVSFVNPPDFENPTDANTNNTYIVVIKARDNNGFVSTQTLTVTVTDVVENLAPTDITLSKLAIYEGNALDAIVGVLSSTDPNAGDTHTYALVNGAGSDHNDFFSIQGNQLRAGMVFNFNNQLLYSIRIRTTDAGGLSYEKIFLIEILKAPYAVGSGNISGPGQITASGYNVTISKGLSAPLNILGNGLVSYSWSPSIGLSANNIANPVANPLQTTTYAVTVTNNQGVSTVVYVTVTVVEDYNVKPNTVITPNGDGKNDQWVISNLLTYPNNRVQVYDKAGRLLFSKTAYQNDWDGTLNGSPLAEGTYYYVIKFDVPQQQIIKGYLTIIRD